MLTFSVSAQSIVPILEEKNILNHLDLGVNAGTTGIGITVSSPIGDNVRVRTGFDFMPRTNVPLKFALMSYLPDALPGTTGNKEDSFDQLSSLMESFTGMKVDRYINTHAKGTMVNFKLLVDFYPLKDNRHWHATAGFYWGSSKVGHVENTIQEAASMMGVIMYNKLYDFFSSEDYLYEPLIELGGQDDYYVSPDVGDVLRDKFVEYGRVGAKNGYFKEGSPFAGKPYMLTPDKDGTVQANMFVNNFKPYIGIGYDTTLSKDGRWNFGFEAGALFWGKPKIYTHERYIHDLDGNIVSYGVIADKDIDKYTYGRHVDMANDVENVVGKVGTYVDVAKAMHVFPVLNVRLTYKLF